MFSRDNRLDYQFFFNTRGAFRPLGWNGLTVIVCFSDVSAILWNKLHLGDIVILLTTILLAIGRLLSGLILRRCNRLRRATSLLSPLFAILLLAPPISDHRVHIDGGYYDQIDQFGRWILFTIILVPVLVVTISRLRFTRIIKLMDSVVGRRLVFGRQAILNVCMIFALIIQETMIFNGFLWIIFQLCALVMVSFGNLQIPAAVLRVVLALLRLKPLKNKSNYDKNLVASLTIFYGLVLGQGMLYLVACVLDFFSFIPRRSLFRCSGFRGQWGVESVNLYYAYALEKCMQEGVLAPKKISLRNFAMDSANSESSKNQLYGIQMIHSYLQKEPTKAQLLPILTTSTKTMAKILRMLDWTSPKDTSIRLYAAKVTAELAKNLRVFSFPGTMQLVSALLDVNSRPKRGNPLLDTDDEQEERQDTFLNTEDIQEEEHDALRDADDNHGQRQGQLRDTDDLLETQTQQVGNGEPKSCMLRCWQRISGFWSVPKEQLLTDHGLLPALAMSIIDSLAGCDQENCVEISKSANLIPKIIGFTSHRSDMNTTNTDAQQMALLKSSLKVLHSLTSIDGEIGMTMRYKISKHPLLLRNLTEILGDNRSSQELIKLVAGMLRNLAVDGNTRQKIGRIKLIITRLTHAFLNAEGTTSTNADRLLRKVAGQALAMLAIENVHNCLIMLKEPEFIKKTMILIHDDKYVYVAASLLRSLCLHARPELRESELKELSHTLREVLEKIMDTEGAELEILIGLSSQICKFIPEYFAREVYDGQIERRFVKKLFDTLNANMKPSAQCPAIRRVVLEQVIYMMEYNSRYADCFNECGMTEALLVIEETMSEAENFRLFLGDAGFMEYRTPLSALVARANELMGLD